MSTHHEDAAVQHAEVQQASGLGYSIGFILSTAFMLAALLMTQAQVMPPLPLLISISAIALLALLAQSVLFFRMDFSAVHIWKTVSLILTVPLFILSIGLTVWMFHYLNGLMVMGPEMPGMSMQPTTLQ
jgi:cytochrome o ubiquinol oxidase operon protein cyoD